METTIAVQTPYHKAARSYILKLIRIQSHLEKKGYVRADQALVRISIRHLKKYLNYYPYNTDQLMAGFFQRNSQHIRTLIPHASYPGQKKLMNEFLTLKNQQ